MSWKSVLSTSSPLSLAQIGKVLHQIQAVEVNPIHIGTICHHSTQFCTNLWCIAIYALHNKSNTKFGTIQLIVAQSVTPKYHH
jgi:hypothetical protein